MANWYGPGEENTPIQHLELSGNTLSLVPDGGSVTITTADPSSDFTSITVTGEALVSTLSCRAVTADGMILLNDNGPPVELLAGPNTLAVIAGEHSGLVYDTVINPPTMLDHLTLAHDLVCSNVGATAITAQSIAVSRLSTQTVTLGSGVLSTSGANLTFNGAPLATLSQASNAVSAWSLYPAVSDVVLTGHTLGGVGHFGQNGNATLGYADPGIISSDFSMTNVLGDFWVGEKVDYYGKGRPGCRFYCGHFQVGGKGGVNDVVNYPSFEVYPTTVDFGSVVQPCQSFTIQSIGGVVVNSALGVSVNGGGGVSVNGALGVSVLGGGGVSVTGGGGVTVTGLGGVAVTGGGGVAITGGLGVAVTGGVGVAVTGGAGINLAGGGGVAIEGGGGIAMIGGTLELVPDALAQGGNVNIRGGGGLHVNGAGAVFTNALTSGDNGYLNITASTSVALAKVSQIGGLASGINFLGTQLYNYKEIVPLQQQSTIYANVTLPGEYFTSYNFAPGSNCVVTLPSPGVAGSWIRITNSTNAGNYMLTIASDTRGVPVATIGAGQSVRCVVGQDYDNMTAWFPA